mmetsp:Transcript_13377/g.39404  ORF Transcript_13377/g.39404 Transcript_13377/m.39404 type:complete len:240 (+) Transcript_13377:49-768(+)
MLRAARACALRRPLQLGWHQAVPHNFFSRMLATKRFPVPNMGDSISEGTVVEIVKAVGEEVKAEEVIMQVETDKVTIDVRANAGGVIKTLFAEVGSNVTVGEDLYELDMGATADASPAASSPEHAKPAPEPSAPTQPKPEPPAASSAPPTGGRVHPSGNPSLIRFTRAKPAREEAGAQLPSAAASPAQAPPAARSARAQQLPRLWSPEDERVASLYKRLPVEQEEMDAVMLGGADHMLN